MKLRTLTAIGLILLAGCKSKQPETVAPAAAASVAPTDPDADLEVPDTPVITMPGLTERQKRKVYDARSFPNPNCRGETLRSNADPDLAYAKCYYLPRTNYHIAEYRQRYAATPEARLESCYQHQWIGQLYGEAFAKPPTENDYSVALKTLCATTSELDQREVEDAKKTHPRPSKGATQ